jgi:Raf kinase inhibitor-like YbhB/YbcL family protein
MHIPQEEPHAMKKTCASLSLCLLAACATTQEPAVPPTAFRLTSPGSPDNAMMQPKNAGNFAKNPNCTGQNVSPPLAWTNVPDKTRSFAIIWDDQAGRNGLGVSHAVIYGIPANVTSFAEGELGGAPTAGRFVPGKNVLGMHWLGPCSPKGNAPQHYVMTLIATTVEPGELPAGLTRPELLKALEGGKALRAASLVLRFAQ